jgi:putative transposase
MQTYSGVWRIEEMAKLLGVSRSGYYAYCRRKPSLREQEQKMLTERIAQAYLQSRGTYGSPRIHAQLHAEGINCSRPRIARLMKKAGIAAKMQRLFKRTTRVEEKKIPAPNILNQDFNAVAPNKKWAADVSYIRTMEGWLYLAVVIDLFSRKVIGLSMSDTLHTTVVMSALEQAIKRRKPCSDCLHHSDKGCQYTSDKFQRLLKENQLTCSMSGTGNCYDNSVVESFFHTLKTEWVYFERFETREHARRSIFEYVEVFYNNQRRHSTLGYVSPAEFEQRYYQRSVPSV